MNTILSAAADLIEVAEVSETMALRFVDDASYEFVGGGTALNGW